MNKVRQTHIGMKNHNIETYLEMSLEDYLSGKNTPNDEYEITNYIGKKETDDWWKFVQSARVRTLQKMSMA